MRAAHPRAPDPKTRLAASMRDAPIPPHPVPATRGPAPALALVIFDCDGVLVDSERRVAGEVLIRKGQRERDWRRRASMIVGYEREFSVVVYAVVERGRGKLSN